MFFEDISFERRFDNIGKVVKSFKVGKRENIIS
jgi:hypothetical protein